MMEQIEKNRSWKVSQMQIFEWNEINTKIDIS